MLCSNPPKFWGICILDNVKKNHPQFSNTALILSADFNRSVLIEIRDNVYAINRLEFPVNLTFIRLYNYVFVVL